MTDDPIRIDEKDPWSDPPGREAEAQELRDAAARYKDAVLAIVNDWHPATTASHAARVVTTADGSGGFSHAVACTECAWSMRIDHAEAERRRKEMES